MTNLGFLLPLLFATTPYFFLARGGFWEWAPLIIALVLIPFIDSLAPRTSSSRPAPYSKVFHDFILVAYVPLHIFNIIWGAHTFATQSFSKLEAVGFVLSLGVATGGLGMTFAHELVHRKSKIQKKLGEIILVFLGYGHFAIAHVFGHHKNVATPLDPATAKKGQPLYTFFMQVIPGIYNEALKIKPKVVVFDTAVGMAVCILLGVLWGPWASVLFFGQALTGIILIETVNYMEHYGLVRKEIGPGRYEPLKAWHSWDTRAPLSGKFLIHLQRHSDHHLNVFREYQSLEFVPEVPELPTGYPGMIFVALIPPLWFRIMDKKLP